MDIRSRFVFVEIAGSIAGYIHKGAVKMSAIDILRSVSNAIRWLNSAMSQQVKTVETLSYVDTIKYFVNNRPDDVRVIKGCILIQDHRLGFLTTWTFLDSNNDIMRTSSGDLYGRELIIKSMDDELKEALGDSKLLIIE